MNMFNWLFGRHGGDDGASREDVREALGRIVGVAPQVKLASRYESRLGPPVGKTLAYVRELVAALPAPRDMTPDAWADDPYLRAMFATPEDIGAVIGQTGEVRGWFDAHVAADHLHAVLGSTLVERRVLGVAEEGGVMRSDVARTTIGFEDKRIRFCNETDATLRQDIVHRIVEQITLEAMSRVASQAAQRDALQEHRALLSARMQMLGRRGAGMSSLIASVDLAGDTTRLQRDFEENEAALAALGSLTDAIEMQLNTIIESFEDPAALFHVTRRTLRLNQMNLVVEEGSDERGADMTLDLARIPTQPPLTRAVALVRIARRDVPPAGTALDEAARLVL